MLRTFGSEIGLGFSKLKKKKKIEQMFIQREIRSFGFFFWEELYVLCKSKTEQTIKPHAQNNHVATTFICQRKDNK